VLLILVGALGATMLVLQAGDRIEVVKVKEDIQAGESVNSSNVTSVMVAADDNIHYIEWSQLDTLKKLKAKSTIYAGTVAVGELFTGESGVAAGKATVGLALKEGQYPVGLKTGDVVAAYRVGSDAGSGSSGNSSSGAAGDSNTLIVDRAQVSYVQTQKSDDLVSSTNLPVTLTVDSDKAAELAQAASNGAVVLVLVPGN
jgi:hypothetical protein